MAEDKYPGWIKSGRLAMRVEGDLYNAYYALPNTMEGAILLASVKMALIQASPELKTGFMMMMRVAASVLIHEATGLMPIWPDEPTPAPEHERTKNA